MRTFALLAGLLLSSTVAHADDASAVLVCPVASAGWTGPQDRDIDFIVIDITGAGIVIDITGAGIVIDITGAGFQYGCNGGWQGTGGFCTDSYAWVAVEQNGPEWGFASNLTHNSDLEIESGNVVIAEYVSSSNDEVVVDFASTSGTGLLTPQDSALTGVTCQAYETYSDITEF